MRPSNSLPAPTPTRILIVRTGAMGDILHALPAVSALRAALPNTHIGWAVEPHWAPLLSPQLVDQIHLVPTRAWKQRPVSPTTLQEIVTLRRELRAQNYDIAVDLQGSIRSAIVARLSGAPRVLGPAHPREPAARHLYRQPVLTPAPNVIAQAAQLVSAAIGQPVTPISALLPSDHTAELWCDQQNLPRGFIFLIPSAGWGAKQWPPSRFAALSTALTAAGHPVLFNAKTVDSAVLSAAGARAIQSTIPQLIALTRRATLVIGGDTGPLHLAAALGRPTLALFGPTDPARNGPYFPGASPVILRNPASVTTYRRGAQPESGLAGITVEEVLVSVATLIVRP